MVAAIITPISQWLSTTRSYSLCHHTPLLIGRGGWHSWHQLCSVKSFREPRSFYHEVSPSLTHGFKVALSSAHWQIKERVEHGGVFTLNCLGPYIGHFQSHPIGKNWSRGPTQTKGSGKCSLPVGPGRGKGSDEHPANLCCGLQVIMRPVSEKTVRTYNSADPHKHP